MGRPNDLLDENETMKRLMRIGRRIVRYFNNGNGAKENAVFSLAFLSDYKMKKLSKRFLKNKRAGHNVLSFAEPKNFPHPEQKGKAIGDIYLNKRLLGGKFERIVFLFIHGLLHLFGYDHKTKSDRIKMEKIEEALMSKVGFNIDKI